MRNNSNVDKKFITVHYDFDQRQSDYYLNAGRYLELVENGKDELGYFRLTTLGNRIFNLPLKERQREFIRQILRHKVFKNVLNKWIQSGEPSKNHVVEIMKRCGLYKVGTENTYSRRASTVLSWIRWVKEHSEELS